MCLTIVEWVQVITEIVTAVTAVVMAVLAYRTYLMTPEQESEEEKVTTEVVAEDKVSQILIFKTSKQKTTLKITNQGLECHIEDSRKGKGGHQWTLTKHEVTNILKQQLYSVNPGVKATVGTINIGPRRGWLYSKSLFPDPDYLKGEIKQVLENVSD